MRLRLFIIYSFFFFFANYSTCLKLVPKFNNKKIYIKPYGNMLWFKIIVWMNTLAFRIWIHLLSLKKDNGYLVLSLARSLHHRVNLNCIGTHPPMYIFKLLPDLILFFFKKWHLTWRHNKTPLSSQRGNK